MTHHNQTNKLTTWFLSSGHPHLVEGLQEQYAQGTTSINKDSVELDVLNDGADN
jgi:hypothetical protein